MDKRIFIHAKARAFKTSLANLEIIVSIGLYF